MANNLRPMGREGANFIFHNNRLFVGHGHNTEAWLGEISDEEASTTGSHHQHEWYRIYTSAEGSEFMGNG